MQNSRTRRVVRIGPGLPPLLASLLILALLAACGSVRSDGTEASETKHHGLEEPCGDTESFTARSVIDELADEYRVPMYRPDRKALTTVRLRPVYDGGAIECIPGGKGSSSRVAKMILRAELGVETDDGAFRGTIPVSLSGYVHSDEFRVSGAIDASELDGSYRRRDELQGGDPMLIEGWLGVETDGAEGALRAAGGGTAEDESASTLGVWNRGRYVATRPERPCGTDERLTPRNLLRRIETRRDGELRFEGGRGESGVRVRLDSGDSPVVCEPSEARGEFAQLKTDVAVEFSTSDGRFEESIVGSVQLTESGRLTWTASRPVRQLSGSFRPAVRVPPNTKLVLRGSSSEDDETMRGSLEVETPDGANPLGVPALGAWSARSIDGDRPVR